MRGGVSRLLYLLNLLHLLSARWHVADVPGVQGELLPAGVWGGAPHIH